MHELIQYLLLGETDQFTDRFQSFIDQIPKPTGAGAAPSRLGFFQGFFLGMFSSIRSINVSNTFNYNQVGQRQAIDLGINIDNIRFRIDEEEVLHIGVVNNHELLRFAFSSNGDVKRFQRANRIDISNVEGQLRVSSRPVEINPVQLRNYSEMIDEGLLFDLEETIYQMSIGNEDSTRDFFVYAKGLFNHSTNALGNNQLFNQEAFQHGFLTGILMNFRYRMNLKSYVEIISGRGYADLILLVRGEGRSFSSTPMLVEFKRSSQDRNSSQMAHEEAEWYARALRKNKMRMLADSNNILCVGLDMTSDDPTIITTNTITDPRSPLLTRLINLAINNLDTEELISPDGTRTRLRGEQGIRTLIGEAYYGFPSVEGAHNSLSRFIVGQALAISRLSDRISLETQFSSSNNITTLVTLLTNQNALVIFNIKEAGRQNELLHEHLPRLSDNTLDIFRTKNITKVVEINIRGYTHAIAQDGSPSPRRYFIPQENDNLSITHYRNIAEYQNSIINRSSTSFLRDIPVSTSIANRFRNAIEHQHGRLKQQINELEDRLVQNSIETVSIGRYEPLLHKIRSMIEGLPTSFVNHEHEFKTILDGLFTALSDMKLLSRNINVIVVPEFQVGGGQRVDLAIQTIENHQGRYRNGALIIVELKYYNSLTEARRSFTLNSGESQLPRQMLSQLRSKNLKALTDGNGALATAWCIVKSNHTLQMMYYHDFFCGQVVHSSLQDVGVERAMTPLRNRLSE